MTNFLKDFYFYGFCKGRKKFVALCGIAQSQFLLLNLIEYLREFESLCKTVFAHESGDPKVQFNKITEGQKSRETVPLIDGCYPHIKL